MMEPMLSRKNQILTLQALQHAANGLNVFCVRANGETRKVVGNQVVGSKPTEVDVRRASGCPFWLGDIVTRDGTDRHRVVSVSDDGDQIEVECVIAPAGGWINVGERETNLPRRYTKAQLNP